MNFSFLNRVPGGWKTLAAVLLAFVVGTFFGGGDAAPSSAPAGATAAKVKWYTCSMHPQIQLQDPKSLCPICAMELIPVMEGGADTGPRQLAMSESAKTLAEVQTTPVERKMVVKEVRLVGKVGYDETRMRTITAWVSGRLDRLYIDYTGVAVSKGAPLVYMYSPELLVAQEALLEADRAYAAMKGSAAGEKNLGMQRGTVKALEDRLRLWGLADDQIATIRARGSASDHVTIRSPISGIVTHKAAVEGAYVKVGEKIYEIADLTRVWIYLDAYESDLAWIKYAQEVEFEAEAYPGKIFRGRISFIDPFLDEKTRTVRVRVNVDNFDGRLKPGMFVRARIHAKLAEGGRIVEPSLAGKWISPVHPEVVMDAAGECPICGTPLVSADSLGYVGEDAQAPLVIPASAPLRTGLRAVVYVRVPDTERPTYEGREILLGPRTRQHYIVGSGVEEGELVVSHGAFKIDSALQILAKPSMMSPSEDDPEQAVAFDVSEAFRESLSPLYMGTVQLQRALAGDDLKGAKTAFAEVGTAAATGGTHEHWTALRARLIEHARKGAAATDIEGARVEFDEISKAILETVRAFGHATVVEFYESYCPMALDGRGASWLADDKDILNPYFGASMLRCGGVRETFEPVVKATIPIAFRQGLAKVVETYLEVGEALSQDDLKQAVEAAAAVENALASVPADDLDGTGRDRWNKSVHAMREAASSLRRATDLEAARRPFVLMSDMLADALAKFGHTGPDDLFEAHCPMAFSNRGADWIQRGKQIRNPYFGASMYRCGDVTRSLPTEPKD